jgi:hypothetical protein
MWACGRKGADSCEFAISVVCFEGLLRFFGQDNAPRVSHEARFLPKLDAPALMAFPKFDVPTKAAA